MKGFDGTCRRSTFTAMLILCLNQIPSDLIVSAAGVGLYLLDRDRPVWLFPYPDTTNDLATTFIYVDAVTGTWIDTPGVGIGDAQEGITSPNAFALSQNHRNPFNPSTTPEYTVPVGASRDVSLEIYDVL